CAAGAHHRTRNHQTPFSPQIYPRKASERIEHNTLPEHFPKREAPPHLELLQNVRAYTHLWS
ncbi:unnamed protein product, partial [Brassica rapa]